MVKLLLQHAANVNAMDKRERRPLHWAAGANHEDIVELLVSAGAEVNCRDKDLMTPLHAAAAATGSFAVVATLLELGADLMARNAAGNTPAHTAALNGHVDAMEEFLAYGFDLKTVNRRGQTLLHLASLATKVPGNRNSPSSCILPKSKSCVSTCIVSEPTVYIYGPVLYHA
jgi:serine/threonine-protein phosphatase 6 regulatory ankyrin repeat subunit A